MREWVGLGVVIENHASGHRSRKIFLDGHRATREI